MRRIVAFSVVAALLAGCAAGGSAPIPPAPGGAGAAAASPQAAGEARHRKGRLVIRIRIPKKHRRHGHYISAGTKGITLQFTGPSTLTESIALTPSDSRCQGSPLTCTISVPLPAGSYTANVSTYDTAPVGGSIPGSAKLLSTAKNVPATVDAGKDNSFSLTLDGVASTLLVSGLPSATAGTAFTEAKAFTVTAQDAAGYTIVGTYDNAVTLANSDASGATQILTSGSDAPPAGTLLSSSDVAKINFNGTAIPPATISAASTGATGGSGTFSPAFGLGTSTGFIGTSVTETITGAGFVNGSTNVLVSGDGVTVSNVTVSSATSLTARFFIDISASTGARNVTVSGPHGTSPTTPFTVSNTGVDIVTLSTDTASSSPAGICPEGASGELRYAICHASAGDTIVFDTQAMCASAACAIALAAPLPPIQQDQTIDGGSYGRITIDGNGAYRAFWVDSGTVALADLKIQKASAKGGNGGNAGYVEGAGGGGAGLGAGLFVNQSTAIVTVRNDYFSNDAVTGGNGGDASVLSALSGAGGGGMSGSGAPGNTTSPDVGGGGGGLLAAASGNPGGYGGGGGGGGGEGEAGAAGGAGYAGNGAGSQGGQAIGTGSHGGDGGFGGGGGGGGPSVSGTFGGAGAAGGFGGGGGGGADTQNASGIGGSGGNGGAGGGGGAAGYGQLAVGNDASGGLLGTAFGGGHGGGHGGGGGAAAGPDIFVNAGKLTTANSGATGSSATAGTGGEDAGGSTDGDSDNTPVYNYGGTVNGSTTTGAISGALGTTTPTVRRIHRHARGKTPKP